jgi:serine/threonine protein kinase
MNYLSTEITIKKKNIEDFVLDDAEMLGEGASGKVYSYLSKNGEKLINKMMYSGEWESIEDFYKDIVWQSMIHTEINKLEKSVKVLGYNEYTDMDDKHYVCFIMEFYEGYNDCFSFLNRRENWSQVKERDVVSPYKRKDNIKNDTFYTVSRNLKLCIIKNLIRSLVEIHNVDIVHGDIKTNNIIIDSSTGDVKIIDFGASLFIEDNRKYMVTDWTHGTLGYRAPEEDNSNLLGKSSDIYSLGVTIIEVWTGDIWYSGETFKQCRNEVLKSLRVIEKHEQMIGSILRKCLNMDSLRRPTIQKLDTFFQSYS